MRDSSISYKGFVVWTCNTAGSRFTPVSTSFDDEKCTAIFEAIVSGCTNNYGCLNILWETEETCLYSFPLQAVVTGPRQVSEKGNFSERMAQSPIKVKMDDRHTVYATCGHPANHKNAVFRYPIKPPGEGKLLAAFTLKFIKSDKIVAKFKIKIHSPTSGGGEKAPENGVASATIKKPKRKPLDDASDGSSIQVVKRPRVRATSGDSEGPSSRGRQGFGDARAVSASQLDITTEVHALIRDYNNTEETLKERLREITGLTQVKKKLAQEIEDVIQESMQ